MWLRMLAMSKRIGLLSLTVGVMLLVVVVGWLERMPLLAWYYVRGLARAEESERGPWVSRVAGLGRGAVPKLVDCLRQSESRACANADAALAEMINGWAA